MLRPRPSAIDRLLIGADHALKSFIGGRTVASRPNPAAALESDRLEAPARRRAAGLMRVNHAGEVAAQALYRGQAAVARHSRVREAMQRAAVEENDHLAWCEQRLGELRGRRSLLNPLWYAGSFAIGAAAGLAGDRWSLGFIAETERQVVAHLQDHLRRLPRPDARSRAILRQMQRDEASHGQQATRAGGILLPAPVRGAMRLASRLMTRTAYWI